MKQDNFEVEDREIYAALMESIDDYVYIGDLTSDKYFISQNMLDDFELPGRMVDDLVSAWGALIHEKDKARFFNSIQDMLDGRTDSHNEEYQIRNRQGQYIWVHCRGRLYRDQESGRPRSFVGIVKKPTSIGKIDQVTGLHTHEKYVEAIEGMAAAGVMSKAGMILLGIDDFSRINTLKTHHFGDIVLRYVAQDLMKMLPPGTMLYRFDGDQFAILLPVGNRATLFRIYEKIQNFTIEPHFAEGQEYSFTISAGAVCFSEIGLIEEDVEKCAAIALKEAKAMGKNRCVFFAPEMLDYKVREQKILQELAGSVREEFQGFHLAYQPITDATDLTVIGAEALLRFHSDTYGALGPDEFIPLLENTGCIFPVGRWVLSQAIKTCVRWREKIDDFTINVNVSCLQFKDDSFASVVEEELKRYGLPPRYLTLEMTETYFVTNKENLAATISYLHELGCKIAMDDFGTGYSSLGRLTEFNIDVVKIDRLFVQSLNANHYNYSFVEAVIRLCHRAGMKVCIEGVETALQQQNVSALHADSLQGFYVSRPVPPEDFQQNFIEHPDCMFAKAAPKNIPSQYLRMSGDKDLLLSMMDAVPLALNLWNQNYQNVECNQAAVKLFGLREEAEYLDRFFELSPEFQPDGLPSMQKARDKIKEAFEQGKSVFYWIHCRLDGESIPCEVVLTRLSYKNEYVVAGYTKDLREHDLQAEKEFLDLVGL